MILGHLLIRTGRSSTAIGVADGSQLTCPCFSRKTFSAEKYRPNRDGAAVAGGAGGQGVCCS